MSVDKLVDSTQLDADLTSVANAIRTKGGTSADLAFPAGFVSAVEAIPTGGGGYQTATGTITLAASDTTMSFACPWQPDCIRVWADDQTTAFATRHCTDFYLHEGFSGIVRGCNANATSKTNFTVGVGSGYSFGTAFGTYYNAEFNNGMLTLTCRSGYAWIADTSYSYEAIKYS